jgi:hypothetical protein
MNVIPVARFASTMRLPGHVVALAGLGVRSAGAPHYPEGI